MGDAVVTVKGAKELRKAFRDLEDKAARKGMQSELKDEYMKAAEVVASAARSGAPHRTGTLAGSVKPRAVLTGARVRAGARYGWYVHEGRRSRGVMAPNRFMLRAAEAKAGQVRDILAEGVARVARKVGSGG